MKHRWSVREWVFVGLFGALWGVAEMTLGSVLHLAFPPLTDTFLVGLIMASIGCLIALCGRVFVPHRGSILLIGLITTVLKAFSLGGVKIGPIVGILAESLLMELGLLLVRRDSFGAFALAGLLAVSWNFFHRFVMMGLLYGAGFFEVATKTVHDGSRLLGIQEELIFVILGVLLVIRMAAGAAAGAAARALAGQIQRRLGYEER
jgi:ABC-type thiamin/hydroxymethylpyrimidine transport system permease subunit